MTKDIEIQRTNQNSKQIRVAGAMRQARENMSDGVMNFFVGGGGGLLRTECEEPSFFPWSRRFSFFFLLTY